MGFRIIKMSELKVNDVFTDEMKLRGRTSYEVIGFTNEKIMIRNRINGKVVNKIIDGDVYLLRSDAN